MNQCKDCGKWTREEDSVQGDCKEENFINESNRVSKEKDYSGSLLYWDYEGYDAGFSTGEQFGCIYFMARDK